MENKRKQKNVADPGHMWYDSEPGVRTVGIYVENHEDQNRKCFIWIRFDHRKFGEKESLPYLREDASISKTYHLEKVFRTILVKRGLSHTCVKTF